MLKVKRAFYDIHNPETIFRVEEHIVVEDPERKKKIIELGLAEECDYEIKDENIRVLKALVKKETVKPKAKAKQEKSKGAE